MKAISFLIIFISIQFISSCTNTNRESPNTALSKNRFGLAIHGGAGTMERSRYSIVKINSYENKLSEALEKGYSILENGGSALNAIEQTILVMENTPLFNAGKGAVFTSNGINELDAAIMDGSNLNA